MELICPVPNGKQWPSLGYAVADWIENNLVYGPGDLLGNTIELSAEFRRWLDFMYQVYPRGHKREGKRRFNRCALSLRKGSAKTELAAWIAAAELAPNSPVRFASWDGDRPVGRPVTDPYIPMISYTEEQTEELAYGALRRILLEAPIRADFEIGLGRIMRADENGKAEAVSTSPHARDGARTTFQHADETHRLTADRQRKAWNVMLANMAKRPAADPWALETTTAYEPGAGSVAEATHEYALDILKSPDPAASKLFFFHRQAQDGQDDLRAAVIEASGDDIARWSDVDRIVQTFSEADADVALLERLWLNRPRAAESIAVTPEQWQLLRKPRDIEAGTPISLGFDGRRDGVAVVVATEIGSGYQWVAGEWHSGGQPGWEVPIEELDAMVDHLFDEYRVCRLYADPAKWESQVAAWSGRHGKKHVWGWHIARPKSMAFATRAFLEAIRSTELSHDGHPLFAQHMSNAAKYDSGIQDDEGKVLYLLRREHRTKPIDAVNAAILSWEARNDVIRLGENVVEEMELYFV